ncbi:MAG: glycine--tRNA ligase subunit beta [Deltaproteobacteria bacterium]|nr:glycine--tRNA ligase subunit beta [Deltaproteobacteria bacterium]MBW1953374.1 glycine--tRNA ligase subunit beta [Deltaproteobacteria bacterium]MBW1987772.1 glycine--tRNA ligase subunit beta [Deltaproteobacteria bacterium]MBW2134571.1 glycine--tRNA ligase subunit beta [Deltaproteobacteria bacterium]
MATRLLVEIGTEEIPAGFIPPVLEEMKSSLRKRLEQERLKGGEITTMATPRRLTVVVQDLAERQEEFTAEIIGPPQAVAFDAEGRPTQAAQGFARAQGVAVEDLVTVATDRGPYMAVKKRTRGQLTRDRLPEILPEWILSLSFPKSMRWGSETITFARPIHWIVALLGDEVIPFTLGGVASGAVTYGHRFLAPQAITLADAGLESYVNALQQAYVLVDPALRQGKLVEGLERAAAQVNGQVVPDPDLIQENTFLVEYPSTSCGNFEEKFLELPDEVLITAMREHQRYFSLRNASGKLLPHFIAINNTLARDPQVVQQGHERVLRARLSDAMFFFQEDSKVPLDNWVEELKGVVFHSLLGTSYEKMDRFRALARYLAEHLLPDKVEQVARAATLCKADLVSGMVGEFPSLQGIMGREYALRAGESPEVAEAIFDHYLPRHAGDRLPDNLVGAMVGLADRLDTICGCFGVGLIPTGAADPYGLRRQALAIINILVNKKFYLDLFGAIGYSLALLKDKLTEPADQTLEEVLEFFRTRLQHLLTGEGYSFEVVDAVLSTAFTDVVEAMEKVRALEEVRRSADFPALAVAFKRVINISRGTAPGPVDAALFEHPAEHDLLAATEQMEATVSQALPARDYPQVCQALAALKTPVDRFFDDVLVMTEDLPRRHNRLALLVRISQTFLKMADFSRITI